MPRQLEHCEICAATSFKTVAHRDRHGSPLTTVICDTCGHMFTNPRPTTEELERFYKQEYRVSYKAAWAPKKRHVLRSGRVALERLGYLAPLLPKGGQILDLGSGGGEMLYILRSLGFEASGIEPNEGYGRHSRDTLGLPVQLGTLAEVVVPEASQDVVTAFHVLEHLENPVGVLNTLAGWLKPGGWMMIEVPNAESRCQWPASRYHLAHIHHFSAATLCQAGWRAGLEINQSFTSEDGGNLVCVFRRPYGALESRPPASLPGNSERLHTQLYSHTPLRHAFTTWPYLRVGQKLVSRAREMFDLKQARDSRELLEKLAQEARQALRHDPRTNRYSYRPSLSEPAAALGAAMFTPGAGASC